MNTSAHIHLSIPDVPISPNGPKGYLRMHWAKRAKYNEAWAWRIRGAMGWPAVFDQAPDMARVTIVQYRRKMLDVDNLYSSCKCLLDGLVDWELIADDSQSTKPSNKHLHDAHKLSSSSSRFRNCTIVTRAMSGV